MALVFAIMHKIFIFLLRKKVEKVEREKVEKEMLLVSLITTTKSV